MPMRGSSDPGLGAKWARRCTLCPFDGGHTWGQRSSQRADAAMFTTSSLALLTGVVFGMAPDVYCQGDMPAHRGRLCGHNASYGSESKHCMCDPAYSCAGEHCSHAHAVAGGTDRSGFDPHKCRGCACVSADETTHNTTRVITNMDRWYASEKRNATKNDCQWVCLYNDPASSPVKCQCAVFSKAHGGTCTLFNANLTAEECVRRDGVTREAALGNVNNGACLECLMHASAKQNATTRLVGFNAEIVISHCVQPMRWLAGFLAELSRHSATVVKITIIAKCGLSGASYAYGDLPSGTPSPQLRESPNVGRCDHAWASYFHDSQGTLASRIFCLKDSYDQHPGFPIVPTRDLVEGSQEGFACAYRMLPRTHQRGDRGQPKLCESSPLFRWSLDSYERSHDQARKLMASTMPKEPISAQLSILGRQEKQSRGFKATLRPYGMWARAVLGHTVMWQRAEHDVLTKARPVMPVCYGGGFATTREAVQQIAPETWRAIAESMERADNIEESHYVERTWAALLAPPLTSSEESAIQCSHPVQAPFN